MIEKILSELQVLKEDAVDKWDGGASHRAYTKVIEIVQEVAKEYGKDTNVRSNEYVPDTNVGKWIPCSERLPQESEPVDTLCQVVNITMKNGTVTSGWCNRYLEKWYVLDDDHDYPIQYEYEDVIAWQPLPAPYQKGE